MRALAAALLVALATAAAAQTPGKPAKKPAQEAKVAAAAAVKPAVTTSAVVAVAAAPDEATEFGIEQLNQYFAIAPTWQADATFKAALADIANDHIKRVSALMPTWVAEERASSASTPLSYRELMFRLYRRLINEVALNSLESAGDAYDDAWLAVYSKPTVSRTPTKVSAFVARMALLEKLPSEQRDAALAGERILLSRWGTVREGLPERGAVSVEMQVAAKIAQIKVGGKRDSPPMSPQLAYRLLTPADDSPLLWQERCAAAQWWLSMQPMADAVARRKALAALRYATMVSVADREAQDSDGKADLVTGYPRLASLYHVEGLVTLVLSIDAEGKLQRADVIKRDIQVPGIRGNRPVAYETLLDAAALEWAASVHYSKPAPERMKAGVMVAEQVFKFALDRQQANAAKKD